MLLCISHHLPLLIAGFALFSVSKFLVHLVSVRVALGRVPGPNPSSNLWGEEWALYSGLPGSLYTLWHGRYGKLVKFSGALGHQVLSITDPRSISFILGEGVYNFPKPFGVRAWFKALLGEGILWVEGKVAHEQQRKILAPALSRQSVRDLTPIFVEVSAKFVSQWLSLFDNSGASTVEIEITNWTERFALDIVARAAFSYDFDCLAGGPHKLVETLNSLTNNENRLTSFYMRALFWLFPPVLMIGKKGEMIRSAKRELGKVGTRMWQDAKTAGDAEGKTVLAHMLRANSSLTLKMSEEQVVAQMRTIISAGYETVSTVISWLLYELAQHPLLQAALRAEIIEAGDLSSDKLNRKWPLLDASIKETLRVHPPILENHHEAARTISIPLSQPLPGTSSMHLIVPKGTTFLIPINVVQQDPDIWGDDADVFRPDRWLELTSNARRNLLAFSEGYDQPDVANLINRTKSPSYDIDHAHVLARPSH
ncbi:hypothetical protein AX15_000881 [Amanita polypyramis BW_CC]|nr:hypothetical protein AX15_000881 [Amanita polypyramis BW_CC]